LTKVALSWSSGKDSAWTLHLLRQRPEIQVAALLTTFNSEANRVAMHAVRRALVEVQAERTGLPLWAVELPWPCSNPEYEERMRAVCQRAVAEGITAVAFGDLFLQDVRDYRVRQLKDSGLEPLFPVWQIPTEQLGRDMIAAGVKAKITCVDPSKLARSFAVMSTTWGCCRLFLPESTRAERKGNFTRSYMMRRCSLVLSQCGREK
jgi:diphthamide synthase (EF-2-diphthine--ammonia ligase)